jgi:hypothetical protein
MKTVTLANTSPQPVTIWVADRPIRIEANSASAPLSPELAAAALAWVKRNALPVVEASQARQVSLATAEAVTAVLALGPVIPLKRFDEKNLMAMEKALLVQIAADAGVTAVYDAETPKKQIVADLLAFASPAPAVPAPVVPPQPPPPSVIGDNHEAAKPQ